MKSAFDFQAVYQQKEAERLETLETEAQSTLDKHMTDDVIEAAVAQGMRDNADEVEIYKFQSVLMQECEGQTQAFAQFRDNLVKASRQAIKDVTVRGYRVVLALDRQILKLEEKPKSWSLSSIFSKNKPVVSQFSYLDFRSHQECAAQRKAQLQPSLPE